LKKRESRKAKKKIRTEIHSQPPVICFPSYTKNPVIFFASGSKDEKNATGFHTPNSMCKNIKFVRKCQGKNLIKSTKFFERCVRLFICRSYRFDGNKKKALFMTQGFRLYAISPPWLVT